MKIKYFLKENVKFRRLIVLVSALLLLSPSMSVAVTRGEFVADLFSALGYSPVNELVLPPDVPRSHAFARPIGSAVKYGLLPKTSFMPDTSIDRHDAVRLALSMMGWGFEANLYESLQTLPDLSGSGDSTFFLAAEMKPPAPAALLIDGLTPLSESGKNSIITWVRNCKKSVTWNRVIPFNGVDFIIYRQGVARPGVPNTPEKGNPIGASRNDPLYVAAVAVHPANIDIRIAFAGILGQERAALSDFVYAYEPIAAINGGFFANSRPLGSMLLDGSPAGKPMEKRSAVAWNNDTGMFAFGSGFARIGLLTSGGFVQFDRFNVAPQVNEASFFVSGVTPAAAGTALDAIEIVVKNGMVIEKREGSWGNHFLPEEGAMIVARGNSRALLENYKPGDPINITTEWETPSFMGATHLIQAGPMLTRGNQIVTDNETFKADITDKRHPRTIVGTDGNRLVWAVIDGRSSVHSLGTTMEETRWVARALGLSTAVNMDGGGSSELIWRGVITNITSDGKERPLPYAVLMMPDGSAMARKNFPQAPAGYVDFSNVTVSPGDGAAESGGEVPYTDTYNPYGN